MNVTMTWTCVSNEASENRRKEGYNSNRTRHTTVTDSSGEIKDNKGGKKG